MVFSEEKNQKTFNFCAGWTFFWHGPDGCVSRRKEVFSGSVQKSNLSVAVFCAQPRLFDLGLPELERPF